MISLRAVKYFFRELHHFAFSETGRWLFDSSLASLRHCGDHVANVSCDTRRPDSRKNVLAVSNNVRASRDAITGESISPR